ncbi:MAG: O-antigen ligase family protein, partial [Desulfobacterales bacterium]|nr:O-antigen ligase family protein [Desulfobacterales bacterium]
LQIPGGERVSAPFEGERSEPNTLGGYLVFMGAIAGGLFIKTENPKLKPLLPILIFSIILPLLFTKSRSSYLAMILACLVLGLLLRHRIIITGLMAVALLLSPFFLPSSVKDRILFTFTQQEASDQVQIGAIRLDTSTSARILGLKELLQDLPKHPVLGYGITGYQFIDAQYPKVLIETGFLGLIAFFYLLYSIFKMAINHMNEVKTPYFKGLAIGFIAGYIGLLFHAIGANTFIIVRIMEPFWFFAGIIAVLPSLERQSVTQPQENRSKIRRLASVN